MKQLRIKKEPEIVYLPGRVLFSCSTVEAFAWASVGAALTLAVIVGSLVLGVFR